MKRVGIIIIIVLLLLPIILLVVQNFDTLKKQVNVAKFSLKRSKSPQYTTTSEVPEYAPKIVNTGYLEYIFAQLNVFGSNAIVDPEIYFGNKANARRYTVTHVQIELVPTLDRYLLGLGGKTDFAGRGTYAVDGDTLHIQVSVDPEQVTGGQYAMEDTYLTSALQTLVYATGSPNATLDTIKLGNLEKNYQEYLNTGIFERPIRIDKGN